jgi:hypothetical protein
MNSVKTTAQIVLAVSMAAAVGLELYAAQMSILVVPFSLWVASPFGLMLWATRSRWVTPVSGWILLGGAVLLALPSLLAYRPAEIASRSTAGLNFVFVPLWQNIAAMILIGVSAVLCRRDRRTSR